jgi:hypothetical protein
VARDRPHHITSDGNKLIVEDLPVHDAPVLLADRSLIALR